MTDVCGFHPVLLCYAQPKLLHTCAVEEVTMMSTGCAVVCQLLSIITNELVSKADQLSARGPARVQPKPEVLSCSPQQDGCT